MWHVVELAAARSHGAKSRWRQRSECIHRELVYSELAVRCVDLAINESPSHAEIEVKGCNG